MESVVDRFIRYVRIDTRSAYDGKGCPSTACQFDLARLLVDELNQLGLKEVEMDKHGFVTALLPSNVPYKTPTIGFNAHIDTSPDISDKDVKPQFIEAYDGKNIKFTGAPDLVFSPNEFPELLNYVGQTLITTDGTTLLGADDKAGIAEIIAAIDTLVCNPSIPHGAVKVVFSPDEEIGTGAALFDVKKFGADFAYTLDGGRVGDFNYENFNACEAKLFIKGRSVHPGQAKNKMVNALQVAIEFHNQLPAWERPEHTEGYEGFFHLNQMNGTVEEASLKYIIRDHDRARFDARKARMEQIAAALNTYYGEGTITLHLRDQYYNMKETLKPVMHVVDNALAAMKALGIEPLVKPIRGGTDGAQFCYMGLPTPNLFTGGHNAHGQFEFIPVPSLEKATQVILKIIEIYAQKK